MPTQAASNAHGVRHPRKEMSTLPLGPLHWEMICRMIACSTGGIWAGENLELCSTQSMRALRGSPWLSQVATHASLRMEPAAARPGLLNTKPEGKRLLGLLSDAERRVWGRVCWVV